MVRFFVAIGISVVLAASMNLAIHAKTLGNFCFVDNDVVPVIVATPMSGGIHEDFNEKYRKRFEKWKSELLSTDYGRQQWENYANNMNFRLTIKISHAAGMGAGSGKFQWNDDGDLVGATITLGDEIDKGLPAPIYYPVLDSLSMGNSQFPLDGDLLAAAKFSHEIGHIDQALRVNGDLLRLQDKLMPVFSNIFLKNGRDLKDERLVEMAEKMGGTPTEIWEAREYQSEVTAMRYLKQRIDKEAFYCSVFKKIRDNVTEYARSYRSLFEQEPEYSNSRCWR